MEKGLFPRRCCIRSCHLWGQIILRRIDHWRALLMRNPPSDWVLADINSRLARMMRIGTVVELDEAAARVRVTCGAGDGKITTAWLPWITARAGPDRTWWALEPGEQVMVLSPSGEMAQGVVLGSYLQRCPSGPRVVEGHPKGGFRWRILYRAR